MTSIACTQQTFVLDTTISFFSDADNAEVSMHSDHVDCKVAGTILLRLISAKVPSADRCGQRRLALHEPSSS